MNKVKETVKIQKETKEISTRHNLSVRIKDSTAGITLIALVITIIVLLILAGVTIATLTGDNGILTQANKAKTETEKAGEDEKLKLAIMGSYGLDGKLNLADLKRNLTEQGISYIDSSSFPLTATVNGESIEIKEDGKQEKLFNAAEWDKTATPEECFIWGSDIEGEEGYDVIIAYTGKIESYTKLIIPSRCTKIDLNAYSYTNIPSKESRSFCTLIKTVELPSTMTEIGGWAFSGYVDGFKALENIIIPESVTSIGTAAFEGCTNLTNITIPNSVTSIGTAAFEGCTNLSSITIPSSVTSIGNGAFGSCTNLTNITIPNSVTSIGAFAFESCTNLTNITIPNSVTSIGAYAFESCTNLTNITVPNSVTSMENDVFRQWTSSQTINIKGYSSAPSGWDSSWNRGCSATINWNQ